MVDGHNAPSLLWSDPFAPREPAGRSALRFVTVAALHIVVLVGAIELSSRPEVREMAQKLYIRLIDAPPPRPDPPVAKPAQPQPVARKEVVRRPEPPPPIMTATAEVPAAPSFTVAPQPPAPSALPPIQAAPPAPPAVTAARFDADYLHNPKPVYPAISRRMNEEGTVMLRVRVSADGLPLAVEIRQSSGYVRLDESARDAVSRWRFVPARRGDEAVESWVGVPIAFKLDR